MLSRLRSWLYSSLHRADLDREIGDELQFHAVGVALGIPAVLAVSRYIESQLYGVSPGDPWAIAGAVGVLLLVAATAGYQPARRASRVDPMIALRYE